MERKIVLRFEDIPNAYNGGTEKAVIIRRQGLMVYMNLIQSEKEETWFTVAELMCLSPNTSGRAYHILLDKQSGNTVSQERQTHHVPQI